MSFALASKDKYVLLWGGVNVRLAQSTEQLGLSLADLITRVGYKNATLTPVAVFVAGVFSNINKHINCATQRYLYFYNFICLHRGGGGTPLPPPYALIHSNVETCALRVANFDFSFIYSALNAQRASATGVALRQENKKGGEHRRNVPERYSNRWIQD